MTFRERVAVLLERMALALMGRVGCAVAFWVVFIVCVYGIVQILK